MDKIDFTKPENEEERRFAAGNENFSILPNIHLILLQESVFNKLVRKFWRRGESGIIRKQGERRDL